MVDTTNFNDGGGFHRDERNGAVLINYAGAVYVVLRPNYRGSTN